MKPLYSLLYLLFIAFTTNAQTAQQHQAPPVNNYPYSRGMFVDCTDDIIRDIKNGNPLGSLDELKTYIRENFITYISLYDLDQGKVIGNAGMEPALKIFVLQLKKEFPQLKIGIIGKKSDYTTKSKDLKAADFFSTSCLSAGIPFTQRQLDSLINSARNNDELQRSETIKFFLRSIKFSKTIKSNTAGNCNSVFDVLYLEDQYWKDAGSVPLNTMKSEFNSYKSILGFLQMLKCSCRSFSVEAEFEPTDYYRLSGWTATDQIEQADPLIDRIMIPFYTSPYNATGAYDINCRLLHLLSDQFSREGTSFYCGFSAQSNAFNFCNSATTPQEHLGRYLSGTIGMASGNMYSVEKAFLDKLNDPAYMCAGCSCYEYFENQYSINNPTANWCAGSMWFTYSMLKENGLFRKTNSTNIEELSIQKTDSKLKLSLSNGKPFSYEIIDMQGRRLAIETNNAIEQSPDISALNDGIYLLVAHTMDGKQFSRRFPVLHR